MVLPALHWHYGVVRLALYVRRWRWIHLHDRLGLEFRVRLRLCLLSRVLSLVGTDGILRVLLVPILRMGRLGWRCRCQRVRSLGQHRVLSYRRSLGKSIYRQLWCCNPGRVPQQPNWKVAGRGYNTNIYTGNTAGYRGAATYNPNTGIVAGGGAGYSGNIYSDQGTAGRGGFAYNTNTNAGVAAGKNNVYAGKDGTVYRYNRQSGDWSSNSGSGWQAATKPDANLQRQQQMRTQGAQRTQTFNSTRGNYGS